MRSFCSLLGIALALAGCSGEVCTEFDCATLTGDASKTGTVSVCKAPKKCDGCYYRKVVNAAGVKVDECQDSATASCESFMQRSAADICRIGRLCTLNDRSCGPSGMSSSVCCSGWCASNGVCEAR